MFFVFKNRVYETRNSGINRNIAVLRKAKGFCHVDFDSSDAVQTAITYAGQDLDGREVRVDASQPRQNRDSGFGGGRGRGGFGGGRGRGGFGGGRGRY